MDYSNGNRTCDLHNEFTKNGELITKFKDGEIKKYQQMREKKKMCKIKNQLSIEPVLRHQI